MPPDDLFAGGCLRAEGFLVSVSGTCRWEGARRGLPLSDFKASPYTLLMVDKQVPGLGMLLLALLFLG